MKQKKLRAQPRSSRGLVASFERQEAGLLQSSDAPLQESLAQMQVCHKQQWQQQQAQRWQAPCSPFKQESEGGSKQGLCSFDKKEKKAGPSKRLSAFSKPASSPSLRHHQSFPKKGSLVSQLKLQLKKLLALTFFRKQAAVEVTSIGCPPANARPPFLGPCGTCHHDTAGISCCESSCGDNEPPCPSLL